MQKIISPENSTQNNALVNFAEHHDLEIFDITNNSEKIRNYENATFYHETKPEASQRSDHILLSSYSRLLARNCQINTQHDKHFLKHDGVLELNLDYNTHILNIDTDTRLYTKLLKTDPELWKKYTPEIAHLKLHRQKYEDQLEQNFDVLNLENSSNIQLNYENFLTAGSVQNAGIKPKKDKFGFLTSHAVNENEKKFDGENLEENFSTSDLRPESSQKSQKEQFQQKSQLANHIQNINNEIVKKLLKSTESVCDQRIFQHAPTPWEDPVLKGLIRKYVNFCHQLENLKTSQIELDQEIQVYNRQGGEMLIKNLTANNSREIQNLRYDAA